MLHEPAMRIHTAVFAVILMALATMPAHAQAFADLKSALVDYSKADTQPRRTCEDLRDATPSAFRNMLVSLFTAKALNLLLGG